MRCRVCKTESPNDAIYCEKCGSKLSSAVENNNAEVIVTFGRADDNKIIINNGKVSSHHGQFRIINGEINIEDLHSSNGIYVDGKKVILSNLKYGDSLKLGADINFDWNLLNPYLRNQPSGTHKQNISEVAIDQSIINIGRNADNDIVINNIKVSRNHARVINLGNEWQIEDLNSSNGTFVNGKKVQRTIFTRDDNITIGGVPLDIESLFLGNEQKEIAGNVSITTKNVTYNVGNKTIVDNITLPVKPGEFVGLIGPSGAGKTTLMMIMTGVVKPSHGDIYINDLSLFSNYNSFKGQIGYVPQDDIIHRELKVGESFQYTAKLRLEHTTKTDITQQVDAVIKTLDLSDTKDTLIGSAEKKGISGGQRKRVNMGQELITEPSILFLDEPTSGLDPKTDLDVMHLLKSITAKGKIVILTTHNITPENFDILTHVIILTKGGKLAFFGPANKASGYFNVNKPQEIFDELEKQPAEYWKDKYKDTSYYKKFILNREKQKLNIKGNISGQQFQRKAGLKQFITLAQRYFKIKLRDKVSTLILLTQAPIIAFLIALVFNKPEEKMQALFVLIIAAIWLGCSNASREIVSERAIFKRERMVNLKIPSYLLSKILILSLLCLVQCLILTGIVEPSINLNVPFFNLIFLLFLTSVVSLLIGLFVSSLVSSNEAAMGLIPIILIPQVILGGLISKFGAMRDFIKILSGFTISRWGFEAALIGENGNNGQMLNQIGFSPDNMLTDFIVLALYGLLFYSLTLYSLKRKDI